MIKKLFLLLVLVMLPATAYAGGDFSQMSPTVKITSYKRLFTGQIKAFGSGSGTVVTPGGRIITNNHVIFDENENKPLDAFEICITFNVQEEPVCEYTAQLVSNDKSLDLAILQINKTDVFGKAVPALKYLVYDASVNPKEQQRVQVFGYPGSGGDSITLTQGQISGTEVFNNATYFKTDSDIDFGNSGGTVLDENGNYIGIPTFIRSLAETLGYFIDIRDARPWIDKNIGKAVRPQDGETKLIDQLARIAKANDTLKFAQNTYPEFSVDLPDGWKFLEINDESLFAQEKKLSDRVTFSLFTQYYQFAIDDGYLGELDEQLARVKERYPDYKKEVVTFAGNEAWKITYTSFNTRHVTYYIPYGYALVGINYSIDLDEKERQESDIKPVLDSFAFTGQAKDNPNLPKTLTFDDPPFSVTTFGDFRIQKNPSNSPMSLLAEAVQNKNYKGSIQIYYQQTPKNERQLSLTERLDETVKNIGYGGNKLIYKNNDVVIDGLKGYLYTIEFEGDKYQEIRKRLTIVLKDGDYEFTIQYDDLTEDFDANLPAVRNMLNSFKFGDDSLEEKGVYEYGTLGLTFTDVQFHRFANAIGNLAEKDIIQGYSDGSFRPERSVSRAEALKIILESKNHLETEKGIGRGVNFDRFAPRKAGRFYDVKRSDWFNKYIVYAIDNNVVSGFTPTSFRPHRTVSLAEALKMAYKVYEIPIWNGETRPWQKKYMDKAYELGLLPRGWTNANMQLTRAELSFLVNTLYEQAKF